ncbi:hypothetical protein MUK42_37122 [Musa troglodytarum]|uniref:Uncharacterized protein n=1 Tax=Musa troglodytarum TaxID=320322 RepID=A0A9E7KNM0_9LILI|nr:hypothetical protein MUK42_37122 [Musa troglodytarum]
MGGSTRAVASLDVLLLPRSAALGSAGRITCGSLWLVLDFSKREDFQWQVSKEPLAAMVDDEELVSVLDQHRW